MGSHLSGIAPAQILSVESYFTDLPDFNFDASLGSTRFLKVARAKHKEGYVVIKVFVIHDPSLPLQSYNEEIARISTSVLGFPNVLPFQRSLLTDRAGFLVRQYMHDNLYDRISTRPFLAAIEKKWIVFQLLCALEQMHSVKVCHGDIKTENILVTSWNWLALTDLASFKPVFLPIDNPADFNYFFDTSRRRTCYLAPERFVDTRSRATASLNEEQGKPPVSPILPMLDIPTQQFELMESMDIFSAGCVVAELFCDGTGLFDLSQLLAYRSLDYNPEGKLSKIDENIKDMILHMIQNDPKKRLSAKEYMLKYRGTIFPEEFYTFLKSYLAVFAGLPVMTSDEKIARLVQDMNKIKSLLYHKPVKMEDVENGRKETPQPDNCFVMIVSMVTSCIRSLKFCASKLNALNLLSELSYYVADEVILELILPYMFYLVSDNIPRVRAKTITTITKCVQLVTTLPKNEANIFPEYILPNLSQLANDTEVIVQCAFAENISLLAETALRFLELAQVSSSANTEHDDDQCQYQVRYDVEFHALHELIQNKVVALLTASENVVKRTLMENGLTSLCVFFGRQKANDVLLSHIITFLNDKQDWQLRASFFDSIVGVAVYIGWHCLSILKPLLQQGLKDSEEFVVVRAIQALSSLVELALLQKPIIGEVLEDVVPFLSHPNRWIRYAAVGYIVACAKKMPLVDVHCGLIPQVLPYFKQPIMQLDNQPVILSVLVDSIPRSVYDYIIRSPQATALLNRLELHHQDGRQLMFNPSSQDPMSQIARKLKSQGISAATERQLVRLKDIILRLNASKANSDILQTQDIIYPGLLDLSSLSILPQTKCIDLCRKQESKVDMKQKRASRLVQVSMQQNNEMVSKESLSDADSKKISKVDADISSSRSSTVFLKDQPKVAQCKHDLQTLIAYKCDQYMSDLKRKNLLHSVKEAKGKQTGWKPKGKLVAHLHEHKGAINRVVTSDDYNFFATASNDSTVKIWEAQKVDGKGWTTRSKFTYTKQVGKINCLTFCEHSTTLACSSDDASIHVFRIDTTTSSSNKLPILIEKRLDVIEDGCAVDMHHFDTGSQSIITYATVHGFICGWDLRQPREKYAWKLKNDVKLGLITSYAVDPLQCWMTCGTNDGALVCWDMRFQLPITQIIHPTNARVRRVACHVTEPSWVVASFQGNNEVSMWDLETSAKRQTLWASQFPPLSQSQSSNDAVLALHSSQQSSKPYFITAGTDKRIRHWDLRDPQSSGIIAGSATDSLEHVELTYNNRPIDGTEVLYESYEKRRSNFSYDERPRKDEASTGHHDCITDIATTKTPQNLLITCSMDGVIKVWK